MRHDVSNVAMRLVGTVGNTGVIDQLPRGCEWAAHFVRAETN